MCPWHRGALYKQEVEACPGKVGKDRCAGRVGLDAGLLNGPGLQRAGEGYLVTVVFHELVEAVPAVRRFKGDPGVLRRRCRKGGQRGGIVFLSSAGQ